MCGYRMRDKLCPHSLAVPLKTKHVEIADYELAIEA